ncbi:hypothetical protein TNIN_138041 [Trichonephila inaurata madagascariensis]|uniref:Uncharacterized protein n=1 Tax=Trichonephila inaurata madagascariensis TaxID=2747483 RepID=A0A8X6YBB8_9ARAC|nr:hypothetical protein TNIN_138041 [Trichonephila inaurata madagascariensis]
MGFCGAFSELCTQSVYMVFSLSNPPLLPHESDDDEHGDDEFKGKDEEDVGNPEEKTKEPHEGGAEEPLPETNFPFNTAAFSIKQVNHYFKELEKAMEHVFQQTLEEASLDNKTYTNTTEEDVEVDGHKFHVKNDLTLMQNLTSSRTSHHLQVHANERRWRILLNQDARTCLSLFRILQRPFSHVDWRIYDSITINLVNNKSIVSYT